jgi:hypothetical protein
MDATALPGHFGSTGNALEELAFMARDTMLVVDDFVTLEGVRDGYLQHVAERLFRATGNHQGRGRLAGQGRLATPRPPRALVLATGEEVPQGRSLRARLLVVELRAGEVDRPILSQCQSAAQNGELATAMAAFLSWIAPQHEELQQRLRTRVWELRSRALPRASHARLPTTLAELEGGWEIWLQFALKAGAINGEEQVEFARRGGNALAEVGILQVSYQLTSDPPRRFLALLHAALAGGHAHLADRMGGVPKAASQWGRGHKATGRTAIGYGPCIGWITGNDLYLDSAASYQAAQRAAGVDRLTLSEQTLRRQLHQRGLLASIDVGRQTLLVRRTLEGSPRHVLHLRVSDLMEARTESGPKLEL